MVAAPVFGMGSESDEAQVWLAWSDVPGSQGWTEATLDAVRGSRLPDLAPSGISDFVPDFWSLSREQRTKMWAHLISKMAQFESAWKPNTIYHEPPPLGVDSVGLMQVSYEDQTSYTLPVRLSRANRDLEKPEINLRCAVAIMEKRVSSDRVFASRANGRWKGLAAYWSVVRSTDRNGRPRASFGQIRRYMRGLRL